jgi:hypothetical protein
MTSFTSSCRQFNIEFGNTGPDRERASGLISAVRNDFKACVTIDPTEQVTAFGVS